MRALERRLDKLEKRSARPEMRDTSRDVRMIVSCLGATQAILATSKCQRKLIGGVLHETVYLDGHQGAITDEELDAWVETFPVIDGERRQGAIEVFELPRARLPIGAMRSLLDACRPRAAISEVQRFYNVAETDLRELFNESGESETQAVRRPLPEADGTFVNANGSARA